MHSTPTPHENDQQFDALLREGLLRAFFLGIHDGCQGEYNHRHRFNHPKLNRRSKGDGRWDWVDQQLVDIAPVFGFEEVWVPTGFRQHPEMLMLQRGSLIVSAHQVCGWRNAPRPADYRSALMPDSGPRLVYTLDEIVEMTERPEAPVDYWTLTYEQTREALPKWVTFGRPARGARQLFYAQDLGRALGYVHPSDTKIELNPETDTPKPGFQLPRTDRQEGEGDK